MAKDKPLKRVRVLRNVLQNKPKIEEPLKSELRQRVALGSSKERLKRRDYASRNLLFLQNNNSNIILPWLRANEGENVTYNAVYLRCKRPVCISENRL